MLDQLAAREAFRAQLLTLVVASTGPMTLAATTTGFSRASGSFLTEHFTAGMEVTGDGFSDANEVPAIITGVGALTLGVPGRTAEAAAANRTLTVGLPAIRQWHGTQTPEAVIRGTRASIVEQWEPSPPVDSGAIIDSGFYIVTINLPGNVGLAAPLRYMMKMRDLFYPGLSFDIDGDLVRVTGDPAPQFTSPRTLENGQTTSQLTVQWRVATSNLYEFP